MIGKTGLHFFDKQTLINGNITVVVISAYIDIPKHIIKLLKVTPGYKKLLKRYPDITHWEDDRISISKFGRSCCKEPDVYDENIGYQNALTKVEHTITKRVTAFYNDVTNLITKVYTQPLFDLEMGCFTNQYQLGQKIRKTYQKD